MHFYISSLLDVKSYYIHNYSHLLSFDQFSLSDTYFSFLFTQKRQFLKRHTMLYCVSLVRKTAGNCVKIRISGLIWMQLARKLNFCGPASRSWACTQCLNSGIPCTGFIWEQYFLLLNTFYINFCCLAKFLECFFGNFIS